MSVWPRHSPHIAEGFVALTQVQNLEKPETKVVRLHTAQPALHWDIRANPITNRGLLMRSRSAHLQNDQTSSCPVMRCFVVAKVVCMGPALTKDAEVVGTHIGNIRNALSNTPGYSGE